MRNLRFGEVRHFSPSPMAKGLVAVLVTVPVPTVCSGVDILTHFSGTFEAGGEPSSMLLLWEACRDSEALRTASAGVGFSMMCAF